MRLFDMLCLRSPIDANGISQEHPCRCQVMGLQCSDSHAELFTCEHELHFFVEGDFDATCLHVRIYGSSMYLGSSKSVSQTQGWASMIT